MNAFTVDLEDWFCSHNLQKACPYDSWDLLESKVVYSTRLVLNILRKHNLQATFFVLGWVADRFPDLIREVAADGHEIGSHGYKHQLLTKMDKTDFENDLEQSLEAIARCVTLPVKGYRAPAFSLTSQTYWATEIIKKLGFSYDSSVYPISLHPDYGFPQAPLHPFYHSNGLLEIPMSCVEIGKFRLPCSGGGYLRMFPFSLFKTLVRKSLKQGRALNFYIHPWELDSETPRVKLSWQAHIRHYSHLKDTQYRLEDLLEEFSFTSIANLLNTFPSYATFSHSTTDRTD